MEVAYDRKADIQAFDDTKAGVKGLADAGITQLPRIFINPPGFLESDQTPNSDHHHLSFPIIDLQGVFEGGVKHKEIVDQVREASETWGVFQIVNHGVESRILDEMINGVQRFFEQDVEVKKKWYTREPGKLVTYLSNLDLFSSSAAYWRDSLLFGLFPESPKPEEIPDVCRDILKEYTDQVTKLSSCLLSIFSESLGLNSEYLKNGYAESLIAGCHYYPACPEPEKTIGTRKHTDADFYTVLLQDSIGGLQVLHQDHWVDVPPTPAALVVNIGDLLQLCSNDKFVSIKHRALANSFGPRMSVACFFGVMTSTSSSIYEPIKELLSEDKPPKYKPTTAKEFIQHASTMKKDGTSPLLHFKLPNST